MPTSRWRPVEISEVLISDDARTLDASHVAELRRSFESLGGQLQLQPIIVDERMVLIDGRHRLEAAKRAGWSHIAALVVHGATPVMRPMLETESNRLRRPLSVLEVESVWRTHYEPDLRAAAKRRQLEGLRKRRSKTAGQTQRLGESLVIGISNNQAGCESESENEGESETLRTREKQREGQEQRSAGGLSTPFGCETGRGESISSAAKRITGYSLDTLNKVAQIRALAKADTAPAELREVAERGLRHLARPGASVEAAYRALREQSAAGVGAQRGADPSANASAHHGEAPAAKPTAAMNLGALRDQQALERTLAECSLLAERFEGRLTDQLRAAARQGNAEREMLRAIRVSLAYSLATVVALECDLELQPMLALRRVGAEVSQLLSKTSVQHIRAQELAA